VAGVASPPLAILGMTLVLGVLLSSGPGPAVASEHFFNSDCLPPANSAYVANLHQQYAAGLIDLKDPKHWRFTMCDPPPPLVGGSTVHSMGSTLDCKVSTNGGLTYQPHSSPCQMTVRVQKTNQSGPGFGVFDTEMLQLDISGGTLPPGVMIRESPTLQSLGRTTIRNTGGGYYIDSFFDIFTELSVDGGQTWMPSEGPPGHMGMDVVNPTLAPNSTWGKLKSLYRH